jgi:hypothetical protein
VPPVRPVTGDRRGPDRTWLLTMAAALVGALVALAARSTLIDDAYITLDYARNLAFHLHWGLTPTTTANTATSPLNVLALGLMTAVTRRPVVALGIVHVLATVALEYGLRRTARALGLPVWLGLLAVVLLAVNPLLASSVGMEIALGAGLTALLLAASVARRPWLFGVLAGLLVLTRPDLAIVVLVVFLWRRDRFAGWWRSLLGALAVVLPWLVFSWIALGSALPDTLIIKSAEHAWGTETFGNGPQLYLDHYGVDGVLSFLPAALGIAAALVWAGRRLARPTERLRRLDRFFALPLAGGLHYLAYTVLGVPPFHWYYGPALTCLLAWLAAATAALWPATGAAVPARLPGYAALGAVVALLAVSVGTYTTGGVPRQSAQIMTNWATPKQYALVGTQLRNLVGNVSVESAGEIGAVAYFCDCDVTDIFADPGAVDAVVNDSIRRHPGLKRTLLEWNFHFRNRNVPPVVPDLLLEMGDSPAPGALADWPVSSPWIGPHVLSLVHNTRREVVH